MQLRMSIDPVNTRFRPELVHESAYIAPSAVVLGNVVIEAEASIWPLAVIRGDTEQITIGAGSNVQDTSVLHADPSFPCILGKRVTVGHAAVVHGAIVEDDVMIGMRAVVMNGAKIGRGSIVGVGALVTEGMVVEPGSIVIGQPAKLHRMASEKDRARIEHAASHYVESAKVYRAATKE